MGLFGKKTCSICGAGIGMLGNKKLADGNLCKDCAKKLSVWFEGRKKSTVEQIKEHLSEREKNLKNLDKFETSHVFGDDGVVIIDKKNKQFVVLPTTADGLFGNNKSVSSIDDVKDKNPDIVRFDQVKSIEAKDRITSREEKHEVNGEMVSYNPRHMTYMCQVDLVIKVEHPYISEMKISLADRAIEVRCNEPRKVLTYKDELRMYRNRSLDIIDYEHTAEVYNNNSLMDRILRSKYDLPDYSYGFKVDKMKNWKEIQKFHYYLLMCDEIKELLEVKG